VGQTLPFDVRLQSAPSVLVSFSPALQAKDKQEATPLHYACMHGHEDVSRWIRTYLNEAEAVGFELT